MIKRSDALISVTPEFRAFKCIYDIRVHFLKNGFV